MANWNDIHQIHPVDAHVGARVRLRRKLRGVSQEELANAVGISFQQIQKYERGTNRISASKLYAIGRHLGVPVAFFFSGLDESAAGPAAEPRGGARYFLSTEEGQELARTFPRIEHPHLRRGVLDLVNAMAETALT